MRALLGSLLFLCGCCLIVAPVVYLSPSPAQTSEVEAGVCDPSCEIRTENGTGSGTMLMWRGRRVVVTASHVVHGKEKISLYKLGVGEIPAVVKVSVDPMNPDTVDVAILEPVGDCDWPCAVLDPSVAVLRGEAAWFCGTGVGYHSSLVKTIINHTTFRWPHNEFRNHPYLTINGEGWYGHSGSGVFVKRRGRFVLVGIVNGTFCRSPRDIGKTPMRCEPLPAILDALSRLES